MSYQMLAEAIAYIRVLMAQTGVTEADLASIEVVND
jgi:hypothetical protein